MNKYVIFGIIIIFIIAFCVLESRLFYSSTTKAEILKPRTWNTVKINNEDIIVYNKKYKSDLPSDSKNYKYKIKPKILLATRIKKPFTKVVDELKSAKDGLLVTNVIDSALPIVNISNEIINTDTKYRILSNIPSLKATIDENKIYIFI